MAKYRLKSGKILKDGKRRSIGMGTRADFYIGNGKV